MILYVYMITTYSFLFFIFGCIIGSFLNVVILRFKTGRGIGGRSSCATCNKTLSWYELIPVVSFFIQKGRCRTCHVRLSVQYPLVELLSGLLSFLVFFTYQNLFFSNIEYFSIWYVGMYSIWLGLLAISVYDILHTIIPDTMLLFVFAWVCVLVGITYSEPLPILLKTILTLGRDGVLLALPSGLVFLFSKGKMMGFGDVKLLFVVGCMLSLWNGVVALLLGVYIATFVSLFLVLRRKKKYTIKSEIPFGPYIILGVALVFFGASFSFDISSWFYTLLFY